MLTRVHAVSLAVLLAGAIPLAAQQASEAATPQTAAPGRPDEGRPSRYREHGAGSPTRAEDVPRRNQHADSAEHDQQRQHQDRRPRRSGLSGNGISNPGGRTHRNSPRQLRGRHDHESDEARQSEGARGILPALRFVTLPNGTTRDFRARVSGLDGRASEELDRNEGSIKSEGNKAGDARTVVEGGVAGASIGALAGSMAGATAMGAGIGAAAGAAAGLATVLFTRGPDAVLAKGTTIEMVLDRNVDFKEAELDFSNSPPRRNVGEGSGPLPSQKLPVRRPGTGRYRVPSRLT